VDSSLHFSDRIKSAVRQLAIATVLIAGFSSVLASSASADTGITFPANGSALSSPPNSFTGEANTNFTNWYPDVNARISDDPQNFVDGNWREIGFGYGWDINVNLFSSHFGEYTVHLSEFLMYNPARQGQPLPDGRYRIEIWQDDQHSLFGDNSNSDRWYSAFNVDTVDPDTIINSIEPQNSDYSGTRTFMFHGLDPFPSSSEHSPFPSSKPALLCRIDGSPWDHCDEQFVLPNDTYSINRFFTVTGLGEGTHTFVVKAVDEANNEDPTPASVTWNVDTTDPTISLTRPAMSERFTLDENVPTAFICDDPLSGSPPYASGIKRCDGPPLDTSKLGNFTYTIEAEDNAGNTHSVTHSYAVDPPKYANVINSNHPIAYYRLGDPLGSDSMADSSGNHRNGEFKNGIALRRPPAPSCHVRPHPPYTCDLNADPQDWAAFFPARDGYGFTNNITAPTTAYTWEAWIKRADSADGSIDGHGGGGQLFVKDGRLALRQTQDTVLAGGPVLTPGQWFHVAATWNGSTTRLYVNGVQVGSSNSANKPPSGTSTLYVGYGDQAPWWHGSLDEVAYYGSALSGGAIRKRYVVGTAKDVPSPVGGPPIQRPHADIHSVANGGLYAQTKVPALLFHCDDLDGPATVASCTATVDGNPILDGGTLPDTPGAHPVVVTATDVDGLTRSHTHTYTVKSFEEIYDFDDPIAYYRLGDNNAGAMSDSSGNNRNGTYKNAQESGGIGISGDLDRARRFFGSSGYGFVSSIPAPRFQSTIEAWVNPDDHRRQSIVGHGDAGEIFVDHGGVLSFRHMGVTVTSPVGLTPGVFTQVAGVWDGTAIHIYVNGELKASAEATRRPSSSSTFFVGFGEIAPWFKGSLDEVAYYGKALTPGRILEHFLADPPPPVESMDPDEPVSPPVPNDPTVDPDTPVSNDPSTGDPVDDPSTGPDVDPSIQENQPGKDFKGNGKGKRKSSKAQLKKCKKITNPKRRKNCVKRVRAR